MPKRLHKQISQLFTLIAALTAVSPAIGRDTLTLNFGVFSTNDPTSVVRTYMPALKELEISMGAKLNRTVDIRMHISKVREQGATYLNQGNVDFASLSNASYLQSKIANPQIRIIAAKNAMNTTTLTPWVAKSGMHDSVFTALRESLFDIKNSKILTGLGAFGFVQSHDSQYVNRSDKIKRTSTVAQSLYLNGKKLQATSDSDSEPELLAAMKAKTPTDYNAQTMADETYQIPLKKPSNSFHEQ